MLDVVLDPTHIRRQVHEDLLPPDGPSACIQMHQIRNAYLDIVANVLKEIQPASSGPDRYADPGTGTHKPFRQMAPDEPRPARHKDLLIFPERWHLELPNKEINRPYLVVETGNFIPSSGEESPQEC